MTGLASDLAPDDIVSYGIILKVRTKRGRVRSVISLLVVALLGVGAGGCGASRKSAVAGDETSSTVAVSLSTGVNQTANSLRNDGDEDGRAATLSQHIGNGADEDDDSDSNSYYDWDDGNVLYYGHPAEAQDARAISASVIHYYAAAARDDGAAVCQLLSAHMARAVPRLYGDTPGLSALHGKTCSVVMSKVLNELHGQMSRDSATVHVGVVRVEGTTGQALLSFDASWPNRYMVLRHEGGAWKIDELLAGGLP
jgi:hypothetical protein